MRKKKQIVLPVAFFDFESMHKLQRTNPIGIRRIHIGTPNPKAADGTIRGSGNSRVWGSMRGRTKPSNDGRHSAVASITTSGTGRLSDLQTSPFLTATKAAGLHKKPSRYMLAPRS